MRSRLQQDAARLRQLLAAFGIASSGTDLFQWWPEAHAEDFWRHMAEQGIWVRLFRQAAHGIRLGLPPNEAAWQRLEQALTAWNRTTHETLTYRRPAGQLRNHHFAQRARRHHGAR